MSTTLIGKKIRFSTTHSDGSVINFSATIVKVEGENVWAEMPAKVRALKFAPLGGKRYGLFPIAKIRSQIIA